MIKDSTEVIKAFLQEERNLINEVSELEESFALRKVEIGQMIKDSTEVKWLDTMDECSEECSRSINEFKSSCSGLADAGAEVIRHALAEDVAAARQRLLPQLLSKRTEALELAKAIEEHRAQPPLAESTFVSTELVEVLELEEQNRILSKRIAALGDELSVLRGRHVKAKEGILNDREDLKIKLDAARTRRRKSGSFMEQSEEEVTLLAQLNAATMDVPGSDEARQLRRQRRLLGAFRAEVQFMMKLGAFRAEVSSEASGQNCDTSGLMQSSEEDIAR